MDARPHGTRILYQVKQLELAIRARLDAVLRDHVITVTQYTRPDGARAASGHE